MNHDGYVSTSHDGKYAHRHCVQFESVFRYAYSSDQPMMAMMIYILYEGKTKTNIFLIFHLHHHIIPSFCGLL